MKKRCLNRRGYFFLIDSVIALGVLAIGVFLIFSVYTKSPEKEEVVILSDSVMEFFANNKIKDVDNAYAGLGGTLWNGGEITNAENTLLQQIAEFHKKGEGGDDTAKAFIEALIQDVLPSQYSMEFWMDNHLLYPLYSPEEAEEAELSKGSTEVLIPSKRIVYGISNKETGEMVGPYSAEVLVWK
ncbi:hypothetical protein KY347_05935 [Candidatus Woesearchaeota archaeon]|nr:hypothetical protein [Candidatus Woesearchaeota archaeon]